MYGDTSDSKKQQKVEFSGPYVKRQVIAYSEKERESKQIRREAELAKRPRPKPKQGIGSRGLNFNRAEREAMIARVLARYPDATVNQIVVTTGLQRPTVMHSEAWAMAQMGREVKG